MLVPTTKFCETLLDAPTPIKIIYIMLRACFELTT